MKWYWAGQNAYQETAMYICIPTIILICVGMSDPCVLSKKKEKTELFPSYYTIRSILIKTFIVTGLIISWHAYVHISPIQRRINQKARLLNILMLAR